MFSDRDMLQTRLEFKESQVFVRVIERVTPADMNLRSVYKTSVQEYFRLTRLYHEIRDNVRADLIEDQMERLGSFQLLVYGTLLKGYHYFHIRDDEDLFNEILLKIMRFYEEHIIIKTR